MKFTMTQIASGLVLAVAATGAQAVAVDSTNYLTIDTGAPVYTDFGGGNVFLTGFSGSWFGMDTDNSSSITNTEKTSLAAVNSPGLYIGQTNTAGPYSNGVSLVGSAGPIVDSWSFFGSSGTNFVTTAVTGSTETGLDLSGWTVAWNNVASIDMGGNAWGTGFTNGTANFTWDGVIGSVYTLDYTAAVPVDSPAFPGVKYQLHLEGTVQAVPEASTYGMMLAGLGLVGFAVRRRKLMA